MSIIDRYIITLVFFCTLALLHCNNGEISVLYVKSDTNGSAPCPSHSECQTLSEYATHTNLLHNETTLAFLPGNHILNVSFYVHTEMNITALFFQSANTSEVSNMIDNSKATVTCPSITCDNNASFRLDNIHSFKITSLDFFNCSSLPSMLVIDGVPNVVIENCNFTSSSGSWLEVSNSNVSFMGNMVANTFQHRMVFISSNVTFTNNSFVSNTAMDIPDSLGILFNMSYLRTFGSNEFCDNSAKQGGVMYLLESQVVLGGNDFFTLNSANDGGALYAVQSNITVCGLATFSSNTASISGGAVYFESSSATFVGNFTFEFYRNIAQKGGALYMVNNSIMSFSLNSFGLVHFTNNYAILRGGAIFVQDTSSQRCCSSNVAQASHCFFQIVDFKTDLNYTTKLYFVNNTAVEAGTSVYGEILDNCTILGNSTKETTGGYLFNQISDIAGYDISDSSSNSINASSAISSEPFKVCVCDCRRNNHTQCSHPHEYSSNCTAKSILKSVYPGQRIHINLVAIGQRNGASAAIIVASASGVQLGELESVQKISRQCTTVSYSVEAISSFQNASIYLHTDSPCATQGITLDVKILDCPPGFFPQPNYITDTYTCHCDYVTDIITSSCNAQDGLHLDQNVWMGYIPLFGGSYQHLEVSPSCPLDYCNNVPFIPALNLQYGDFRDYYSYLICSSGREGRLCGSCSYGYSLHLGSSHCGDCSDNKYLALLLFFAAAGVILVAFLLLLNLTVAMGTINGLVFYANIVSVNRLFIPPSQSTTYLDILKVFIAWINLDYGIDSCFYDGMDAYAKTWLQYVFPLYIWGLIGLVFLFSHYSTRVSKVFGTNPVATLATLILLSYTKVLRTIIASFSSQSIYSNYSPILTVWLYDGNIPFLDPSDGRHLGLFSISVLILVLLFVPYTLLLLTSQWLQIKSHWKVLSWLNKPQMRAFLDAYHAPYKPRHRYWTGLLLLVRLALLITSARTMNDNPSLNFLVTLILVLFVQMWAWNTGGVYKKWYLNSLEAFFFLNIGLLTASTQYISVTDPNDPQVIASASTRSIPVADPHEAQVAASSTLVSASVVAFLGILVFHVYSRIKARKRFHIFSHRRQPTIELKEAVIKREEVTTTSVSLREPLLDSTS